MTAPGRDESGRIRESWQRNADAWVAAVRARRIESRRVATDAAVVAAVRALAPGRVLDVGCGEGWLCRALAAHGIETVGIDACAALVSAATASGVDARLVDYDALARTPLALGHFDAAVCNFSLFERELQPLLEALAALLRPNGTLLVQTVHPAAAQRGEDEGWREERYAALGADFVAPMPWYLHTPAGWRRMLATAGFHSARLQEVRDPRSGCALSLIAQATPAPETAPC